MSIERVREYMKKYGMEDKILEFSVSSATVELAAEAVGTEGKRIAKSLSFLVNDKAVMIVAAGDGRIDNKKYKAEFSCKAKMLTPEQVDDMIGHSIGGVCPFAVNEGVQVYLDESLKRFETVFPACGSSNSAIELTIPQLEELSGFIKWVDICKLPEE
ncbi:MAG: YbaK/EbsC family protein [Clostridia bacterium]|jgi:prolyl-tRNA editing enzyme YbaK/EbsC (Cys-tRNA(Pro) deacylase)|nr:YbaK/EbsC family protein [Clostridia bacterium]MBQ1994820.1 YbaK/EbsC family protein [Clostridia bacterium]MBQ5905391.1 YbaK/EbsC family protein [Clostridia bacterium]